MNREASLARKSIDHAMSRVLPMTPSGERAPMAAIVSARFCSSTEPSAAVQTRWVNGVSTYPGATALARTPSGPSSAAATRVSWITPALATPYMDRVGTPVSPPDDETLTIAPRLAADMTRPAAAVPQNTPLRLTARTASSSSSAVSTMEEFRMIPATLAHTSIRPVERSAARARSSTAALSPTSVGTTTASGTSFAAASSPSAAMSASTTRAPALAYVTAVSRPMPDAAPVTTAVRSSSEKAATTSSATARAGPEAAAWRSPEMRSTRPRPWRRRGARAPPTSG